MVREMTNHALLPPSPVLSPGRQLCGVPQSPILTYRPGLQPVASPVPYARHVKSTSDLSQGVYAPDLMRMRTPAAQSRSAMPVTFLPQGRACSPVSNRGSPVSNRGNPAPLSPHGGNFRTVGGRPVVQVSRSPSPVIGRTSPLVVWKQTASAAAPAGCVGRMARSPSRQAAFAHPGFLVEPAQGGAPSSLAPQPWALRDAPSAMAWKGSLTSRAAKTEASVLQEPRTAVSPVCARSPVRTACRMPPKSPKSVQLASQEPLQPPLVQSASALSLTLPVDGREAKVAHVRESLLRHIHSVQQEIARLQDERQKMPATSHATEIKYPEVLTEKTEQEAACRLQQWWRSRRKEKEGERWPKALKAGPAEPLCPRHFAAARIQRWFRLSRWRRRFVDVSVQIGWLGSLAWLQEQNLLYGTELADKDDVRWWSEQRAAAPLDRDVDPWGALKLRGHLDKMWYGHTNENSAQEEEALLLHHHQKLIYQQEQKQKKQLKRCPPPPQPPRPQPKPVPQKLLQPNPMQLLKKQSTWHMASAQSLHAPAAVPAVKITQRGLSGSAPKNCKSPSISPSEVRLGKQAPPSVRNYPPRVPTMGASAALPATRGKSPLLRPGGSWAPTPSSS